MPHLAGLFTLGKDAEIRTTQSGDTAAKMALAYNYGRKGENGKFPTQWIDATLWGDRANKLSSYLVKGKQFFMVLEDVHIETYTTDRGQGTKMVAKVEKIEFTRGDNTQQSAPAIRPAPAPAPRPAPPARQASGFDDMNDDIPFRDPLAYRGVHLAI